MSQLTDQGKPTLTDGARQNKRNKRPVVERATRLSRNEKIGDLLKRIVAVADAFENQLKRNGISTGKWATTRTTAQEYIDILLGKGGELPEGKIQPMEEEFVRFETDCNNDPKVVPTSDPTTFPALESNPTQLDDGKVVSPSGYVDAGYDFGNDDRGFDPFYTDSLDNQDPTVDKNDQNPVDVLDQEDSSDSSIADKTKAV